MSDLKAVLMAVEEPAELIKALTHYIKVPKPDHMSEIVEEYLDTVVCGMCAIFDLCDDQPALLHAVKKQFSSSMDKSRKLGYEESVQLIQLMQASWVSYARLRRKSRASVPKLDPIESDAPSPAEPNQTSSLKAD